MEKIKEESQKIEQKEVKVPRVYLEILIHGVEDDRPKIDKMTKSIRVQMDNHERGVSCRILYYIDKGEKTPEEKKQWLKTNACSKYTLFAPESYEVTPNWLRTMIQKITRFESAHKSLKISNIGFGRMNPEEEIQEAEVIEEPKPGLSIVKNEE